jgi:DNA-directed RNA polymerase subunit K
MERETTRFEKARIIGARALQISCGAPTFADPEKIKGMLDPIDIAEAEYDEGLIPISVIRN